MGAVQVQPIADDAAAIAQIEAAPPGTTFEYSLAYPEELREFKAALNYLMSTPGHVGGALSLADFDSFFWDPRTDAAWKRFTQSSWGSAGCAQFGCSEPGLDPSYT